MDYLLIDLPPGTGDVQLSLVQTVPINGAVVVTTPSEVAMEDARKAVRMFEQVKTPIVGLVENMSYLVAPGGERIDVFGQGGGRRMAEAMNIPFLVELPLDPKVRIGGDSFCGAGRARSARRRRGVPRVGNDGQQRNGRPFEKGRPEDHARRLVQRGAINCTSSMAARAISFVPVIPPMISLAPPGCAMIRSPAAFSLFNVASETSRR